MLVKMIAIISLLLTPLSGSLWYNSHRYPQKHRYDLTLYKSVWLSLREGVVGVHLLSMPTKVASRSGDFTPLSYDPVPSGRRYYFSSRRNGPFRDTWIAFPLFESTSGLVLLAAFPLFSGPLRRRWRVRRGRCLECGYSLHGNHTGRCPECGVRTSGGRGRSTMGTSRKRRALNADMH